MTERYLPPRYPLTADLAGLLAAVPQERALVLGRGAALWSGRVAALALFAWRRASRAFPRRGRMAVGVAPARR